MYFLIVNYLMKIIEYTFFYVKISSKQRKIYIIINVMTENKNTINYIFLPCP